MTHALLALLPLAAVGQDTGVLGTATCEALAPRELRFTVTLRNYGAVFARDLHAFIHFDRSETGERLYTQPEPGLRPMVGPTQSSLWTPDETITLSFGPVTVPVATRRTVYVKLGLYDPEGGVGRFPLVGSDGTGRTLIGVIDATEDACRWADAPPVPRRGQAEGIGVRPRGLVREMPDPPAVRFGEEDLERWSVESMDGGGAKLSRTREDLCWSEASLAVTYTGEGLGSAFVLRPPAPLPVADEADVARIWIMGRSQVWAPQRPVEEAILSHWVEFRDPNGETRRLRYRHAMGYPFWYVARARIPADWPRPLVCTGIGFSGCTNPQPRTFLLDALVFAKERLDETLTTGVRLDGLPYPTHPDGLLPDAPPQPYENRVSRRDGTWVLSYQGPTDRVEYFYTPLTGSLDDIRATWTSGDVSETMSLAAEGGLLFDIAGRVTTRHDTPPELIDMAAADAIAGRWRASVGGESVEYTIELRPLGRSLVVEVRSDSPSVAGIDAGAFVGPPSARFVPFPYWTYGLWDYGRDGGVVMTDNVFVSAYPDWYHSRAGHLTFGSGLSHDPEALVGGAVTYAPGVE